MSKKTAILIFANSASQESINKPFTKAVSIFEALNTQLLKTVKKTNLPYFIFDEKKQQGCSFSQRFSNAIQFVFDQGYKNVIAVGNDTPQLTSEGLKIAAKELENNKTVIGPSTDGGFYLLGIQKKTFELIKFEELPWQTRNLHNALFRFLKAKQTFYLKTLQDIDILEDAIKILNFRFIKSSLKKILSFLNLLSKKIIFFFKLFFPTFFNQKK